MFWMSFPSSTSENMPGVENYDFQMYCSRKINVLADHYYIDDYVKRIQ